MFYLGVFAFMVGGERDSGQVFTMHGYSAPPIVSGDQLH